MQAIVYILIVEGAQPTLDTHPVVVSYTQNLYEFAVLWLHGKMCSQNR